MRVYLELQTLLTEHCRHIRYDENRTNLDEIRIHVCFLLENSCGESVVIGILCGQILFNN